MTEAEAEWVGGDHFGRLVTVASLHASRRKLRLAACGCVRLLGDLLAADAVACRAVLLAEGFADGLVTPAGLAAFRGSWRPRLFTRWPRDRVIPEAVRHAAMETTKRDPAYPGGACRYGAYAAGNLAVASAPPDPARDAAWERAWAENDKASGLGRAVGMEWDATYREASERHIRQCCGILRDIFGNPFKPVPFDPSWRSENVLLLARQMYESRDFGAMPVLADALQEAGCDNDDVLAHCRGAGNHVRGCHIVDLVLDLN